MTVGGTDHQRNDGAFAGEVHMFDLVPRLEQGLAALQVDSFEPPADQEIIR